MEIAGDEITIDVPPFPPPRRIFLSPFPQISPSPRRLSGQFYPPAPPVPAARQLPWVTLQGRIVGAEEATSARAIGGGLSPEEAVAWELFSPMQRVLIVAIIAVAVANSKKNRLIVQLRKAVENRDQVLSGMQEKLDNLCEQLNYSKDLPDISSYNFKISSCGCRLCDRHQFSSESIQGCSTTKADKEDDMIKCKTPLQNDQEPEERRMSDLSDWAPSVTSSVDGQWNTLSREQDIGNFQEESEAKDAMIKERSDLLNPAEVLGSKRISELEDVIRRKNMIITKLRKDLLVLEQKVIHLARIKRPSFSKSNSSPKKLPSMMINNVIFDMDGTTSPSSSDSDCPSRKTRSAPIPKNKNKDQVKKENVQTHTPVPIEKLKRSHPKITDLKTRSVERPPRPIGPLQEKSLNQQTYQTASASKSKSKSNEPLCAPGDIKTRRNGAANSRVSTFKRWA